MIIAAALLSLPTIFTGLDASSRFYQGDSGLQLHKLLAFSIGGLGVVHALIRVALLKGLWYPKRGITIALSSLIVLLIVRRGLR